MSDTSNEAVLKDLLNKMAEIDEEHVGDFFTENFVNRDNISPPLHGLEGAKQLIKFFEFFRNGKFEIEDSISEGNRIAVRVTWTGKHTTELMGIPPTGKEIKLTSVGFFRLENGKFAENLVLNDNLALFQQLGIVSLPPGP